MAATEKQKSYALSLLAKNGYSVRYMDAKFKELGVSMNSRRGTVESWLDSLNKTEISQLIDRLK